MKYLKTFESINHNEIVEKFIEKYEIYINYIGTLNWKDRNSGKLKKKCLIIDPIGGQPASRYFGAILDVNVKYIYSIFYSVFNKYNDVLSKYNL